MEASALMIVTEFRGADLGMILTVSDLVYRRDWPNIFGTDEYRANCMDMADVICPSRPRPACRDRLTRIA